MRRTVFALILVMAVYSCAPSGTSSNSAPTIADAKKFMDGVNETTFKLANESSQAGWVS